MKSLFTLSFIPQSVDFGLLVLRLWLGLTMLLNHGLDKATHFAEMAKKFPPIIYSSQVSLGLVVFAEVGCSVLLVIGLLSRFASLGLAINMGVAFFVAHKASLAMGPASGELPFIYLAGYVALFFAGPGKLAADKA
jgi:putative oxidoreductase